MIPDRNGKPGSRADGPPSKGKKGAARPRVEDQVDDLPLVNEDGLYFRVIGGTKDTLAGHHLAPAVIAESFRLAFTGVWERLPPADRQRLTTYWQSGPDARLRAASGHDKDRAPLIQVVCQPDAPEVVIARFGLEITFPAWLVVGQPGRLPWEIARVLAQVFRLANREHWGLVLQALDEPMEAWERQGGAGATEAHRQRKLDELEADYLRRFEASVGQILRRWRVVAPCG